MRDRRFGEDLIDPQTGSVPQAVNFAKLYHCQAAVLTIILIAAPTAVSGLPNKETELAAAKTNSQGRSRDKQKFRIAVKNMIGLEKGQAGWNDFAASHTHSDFLNSIKCQSGNH